MVAARNRIRAICALAVLSSALVQGTAHARLWEPSDMTAGLVAWYDAADPSAYLTSGSSVTNWLDKSGRGVHLSQTDPSKQPQTGVTNYNGVNVFKFDPAPADNLNTTDTQTWDSAYIICDNPDMSYHKRPTALGSVNGGNSIVQFSNNDLNTAPTPGGWVSGTTYYIRGRTNSASATDAALVANPLIIRADCSWTEDVSIGSDRQIDNRSWNGGIGEVLYLNNASAEDMRRIEGYLAWKWGLNADLPMDHPYYDAPPEIEDGAGTLFFFQ